MIGLSKMIANLQEDHRRHFSGGGTAPVRLVIRP